MVPAQRHSRTVSLTLAVHMLDSPPQVRDAQKGLPTGSVYTTNERNLEHVGTRKLQWMLDTKNWTELGGMQFAPHSENLWK